MRSRIFGSARCGLLCWTVALAALLTHAQWAAAQQNGGIEVDAAGVVRTQMLQDPSGRLTLARQAAAMAKVNAGEVTGSSELRKVSLTRLEKAIAAAIARGEKPDMMMEHLAGLTSIEYVFCLPDSGDVVIAGPAEPFFESSEKEMLGVESLKPVLLLQDLVAALRAYAPGAAPTTVLSVSIDPTAEGLANLQAVLARVGGFATPRDTESLVATMRKALGDQTVTLKGVDPKTHFANIFVAADYRMKLIGIGLVKPAAPISTYVDNARGGSANALVRWYFVPDYECVRVSDDRLAMQLVGGGVKLVGANELVNAAGGRTAAGGADAASRKFTESFTRNYDALAEKDSTYAQLRNLVDMSIAAAYIQSQDFFGMTGWKMSTLGDEAAYPIETLNAAQKAGTAINAIWKGRTLMTPIGGGINVQPHQALRPENLLQDADGQVKQMRNGLSVKEIPADQWWWD
ncbi:MAG: DUF1598 domain-containing protein [Planctomycetales bacterium]|nr:DUF1598 domain-containing protein [Planctomycetales bacterium]